MSSDLMCRDGSTVEDLELYETVSWWMEGIIQIIVNIIGIIANCIAIPVLLSRKLTNVFNRTLAILAILDTIFNMCDILESVRMYHGGDKTVAAYLRSRAEGPDPQMVGLDGRDLLSPEEVTQGIAEHWRKVSADCLRTRVTL